MKVRGRLEALQVIDARDRAAALRMGRERRRLEGAVPKHRLEAMERRGWIDRSRKTWLTDLGRQELRAWSAERVRPYQLADVVDVPGVAEEE